MSFVSQTPFQLSGRYADRNRWEVLNGPGDSRVTGSQIIEDEGLVGEWAGKVVFITGVTSGVGDEIVKALLKTGATIYCTTRDLDEAESLFPDSLLDTGLLQLLRMNPEDLNTVRQCAELFRLQSSKLHIIINNEQVMGTPKDKDTTQQLFELHFGVNHVAHYVLFELLRDMLSSSSTPAFRSRVINLSHSAHRWIQLDPKDLNFDHRPYSSWFAFGSSKLCALYFTNQIERMHFSGILHAYSVHSGAYVGKVQQGHVNEAEHEALEGDTRLQKYMMNREQACATTVYAAVSSELEGKGGLYLEGASMVVHPCAVDGHAYDYGYAKWAFDKKKERALWAWCKNRCQIRYAPTDQIPGTPNEDDSLGTLPKELTDAPLTVIPGHRPEILTAGSKKRKAGENRATGSRYVYQSLGKNDPPKEPPKEPKVFDITRPRFEYRWLPTSQRRKYNYRHINVRRRNYGSRGRRSFAEPTADPIGKSYYHASKFIEFLDSITPKDDPPPAEDDPPLAEDDPPLAEDDPPLAEDDPTPAEPAKLFNNDYDGYDAYKQDYLNCFLREGRPSELVRMVHNLRVQWNSMTDGQREFWNLVKDVNEKVKKELSKELRKELTGEPTSGPAENLIQQLIKELIKESPEGSTSGPAENLVKVLLEESWPDKAGNPPESLVKYLIKTLRKELARITTSGRPKTVVIENLRKGLKGRPTSVPPKNVVADVMDLLREEWVSENGPPEDMIKAWIEELKELREEMRTDPSSGPHHLIFKYLIEELEELAPESGPPQNVDDLIEHFAQALSKDTMSDPPETLAKEISKGLKKTWLSRGGPPENLVKKWIETLEDELKERPTSNPSTEVIKCLIKELEELAPQGGPPKNTNDMTEFFAEGLSALLSSGPPENLSKEVKCLWHAAGSPPASVIKGWIEAFREQLEDNPPGYPGRNEMICVVKELEELRKEARAEKQYTSKFTENLDPSLPAMGEEPKSHGKNWQKNQREKRRLRKKAADATGGPSEGPSSGGPSGGPSSGGPSGGPSTGPTSSIATASPLTTTTTCPDHCTTSSPSTRVRRSNSLPDRLKEIASASLAVSAAPEEVTPIEILAGTTTYPAVVVSSSTLPTASPLTTTTTTAGPTGAGQNKKKNKKKK